MEKTEISFKPLVIIAPLLAGGCATTGAKHIPSFLSHERTLELDKTGRSQRYTA